METIWFILWLSWYLIPVFLFSKVFLLTYQSLQHPTKNWGRVRFFRSEHWGLNRFYDMLKVTPQPERTVLIWICIKYNTLSAQPGSVLHVFLPTFNILSAGVWVATSRTRHLHWEAVCMRCPAPTPHLFSSMRFSSHVTQGGQSAYSTPHPHLWP